MNEMNEMMPDTMTPEKTLDPNKIVIVLGVGVVSAVAIVAGYALANKALDAGYEIKFSKGDMVLEALRPM